MRFEHKAGIDIVRELALRLYPSSFESFREAISNCLDEGSKKVEVSASRSEVIVEDWGKGIEDLEKFRTFGDYAKAKSQRRKRFLRVLRKFILYQFMFTTFLSLEHCNSYMATAYEHP